MQKVLRSFCLFLSFFGKNAGSITFLDSSNAKKKRNSANFLSSLNGVSRKHMLSDSELKLFKIQKKLEIRNFCLLFTPPLVGNWYLVENFLVKPNEIYAKIKELLQLFFENFKIVEILTSTDDHFKNGT